MIGSVLIYDDWHIYYIFTFIFIGPGIITLPVLATTPQATRDQQFVIRWLVMGSEVRAADLNANKEVELDKDAKTNCDNFCYCMMRDVKTTKHCHFHTCACTSVRCVWVCEFRCEYVTQCGKVCTRAFGTTHMECSASVLIYDGWHICTYIHIFTHTCKHTHILLVPWFAGASHNPTSKACGLHHCH